MSDGTGHPARKQVSGLCTQDGKGVPVNARVSELIWSGRHAEWG